MRTAVKSKENETELRDYLTKLDGFEGIKDSRSKIETEFNSFREEVTPTLQGINQFNESLNKGDFKSAFDMVGIKEDHLVNHLFSNEDGIKVIENKLAEFYKMQDSGPQAQEAYQNANKYTQENQKLNYELQSAQQLLQAIQANTFNQTLGQAINSNMDAVSKYEAINGQGSFESFARTIGDMEWNKGNQMQPDALVGHVVKMLGYSDLQPTNQTVESTITTQEVKKQPATLPNLGSGSSVSSVGKVASSMDEFTNMMRNISA